MQFLIYPIHRSGHTVNRQLIPTGRNENKLNMPTDLNATTPVRAGEELPLERLEVYLKEHLPDSTGTLSVEQFSQGHSNLTYLVRIGKQELVLRRPPFGNQVKSAHDMGREYRVLSKLHLVYNPAPRPYLYCDDTRILGDSFYVMERRYGLIFRKQLPPGIVVDHDTAKGLSEAVIDNLALLHSLDYQEAGLNDLGKPDGYARRQVMGWSKRYEQAMTDTLPGMDRIASWLIENIPHESSACVIHNDYKYDNLVLNPGDLTNIVAVLDWEMATIGDPLMDLGTMLGYWIEVDDPAELQATAVGPTALPGNLTRRELIERYQMNSGREVTNAVFYYCFGIFKITVILQQIYARFVRGHTRDARFANLNKIVAIMCQQADATIQKGELK
ncbi:MAG TPA: phosphotransferase family protein [Pirellula sp.]|nr:phosphotransferase family protein [Pirellula sp.]